ncbi:Juvenile hormone acid O-methyltransferase [Orchesella cincta]|uniref:Juvenile hormone acid O-methyltransferase n=1 Tax=Orchesella cincta TaxID=48709 RepID=A0A1D2MD47_ORCCI|nr:Juvenile hormone acid O-methyltransferase [Orchesella cincta]
MFVNSIYLIKLYGIIFTPVLDCIFVSIKAKALAGGSKNCVKPVDQFLECYLRSIVALVFSTLQAFKEFANYETWKPYMTDYEQFYPVWSEFTKGQELSEMRQLLESSGFRVVELEFLKRNYHFDSIDSLLEIALSANPCLNNIPKDLYGAFKEDLKKFYFDYEGIPMDSQTFDLKYDFIWGVIEKV